MCPLARDGNTHACAQAGKSIYLRQVALLQILAQMGYCVPAGFASYRLVDQVFTRIGNDDALEANASTFALECQELSYILQVGWLAPQEGSKALWLVHLTLLVL